MDPGSTLCDGRFLLRERLGVGLEATAFAADDRFLGIEVVCRVAHSATETAKFVDQFLALSRAFTKSLVRTFGLHKCEGLPVLILERVLGEALDKWVPKQTLADKIKALQSVADAVAALHEAGRRGAS